MMKKLFLFLVGLIILNVWVSPALSIVNPPLGLPFGGNLIVEPCATGSQPPLSQLWWTLLPSQSSPVISAAADAQSVQWCWDLMTSVHGSTKGANVQLYQCAGDGRQNLTAAPSKQTPGLLLLTGDGQAVAVAGAAGTNVEVAAADPSAAQQAWQLAPAEGGGGLAQIYVQIGQQYWCATNGGLADITADRARTSPLVIGHRGTRTAYPENTTPAFIYALSNKADGIESDLRLSKDGQIVLIHDATLDRTTNCTGNVADYTLEQLQQQCDACSWFDPDLHCPIPTFNQTLQMLIDFSNNGTAVSYAFLIMDLKIEGLALHVSASLSAIPDSQPRVLASCWTETQVQDFGAILPGVVHHRLSSTLPTGYLKPSFWTSEVLQGVRGYSLAYNNFLDDPFGPLFIRLAHTQMMSVVAWTLTDQPSTLAMINLGCNALICDSPLECQQMVELYRSLES